MAVKGGGFQKNSEASGEIPSSSLADIAFLLLIFFMVTTVFQADRDRPSIWPEAEAAEKAAKEAKEAKEARKKMVVAKALQKVVIIREKIKTLKVQL